VFIRLANSEFLGSFNWSKSLLLGLVLVIIDWLFLTYALNYDSLQPGDALDYWNNSLNWQEPYDSFHVPGYAFALAAMRGFAGSFLEPSGILFVTTLLTFSVAVVIIHRLGGHGGGECRNAFGLTAVVIFVLWPMVGTTYVAYPIADMFGITPLVVGLLLLVNKKTLYAALCLGLALIAHKAVWPFVALLLIAHLISARSKLSFVAIGVTVFPLGVLWVFGWQHHESASWLLSKNLAWEFQSTGSFPVLDGIFGSLLNGGSSGVVKGLMVLGIATVSFAAGVHVWRLPKNDEKKWYSLAIFAAILTMVVTLNEREIWAVVRFGRLLAIPLVWHFGEVFIALIEQSRTIAFITGWTIVGMIGSQFVFGYYMAKIWSAGL